MGDSRTRLPEVPADWFTQPLMRFLRIESMAGAVLLLSTLVALALANAAWSMQFMAMWNINAGFRLGDIEFSRSLKSWINDGLMTLFFFVLALELKRELILGELRDPRMAAFPLAAAVGGMVAPVGLYLLLIRGGPGAGGWGAVISTDTAFAMGCLAALGSRISQSLRLFLLSVAIFDDIGAVLVVAIGYGGALNWIAIGFAGFGLAVVAGIARLGIRSVLIYFAVGAGIWLALDASGIHATLTGIVLGLMTPARSWVSDRRLHAILDRVIAYPPREDWSDDGAARRDLRQAGVAAREAVSPIERLEFALHPWVAFMILPLFALANAGVSLASVSFDQTLAITVFAAFVVGKPIGIVLFSFLSVTLRLATRPPQLSWGLLASGSLLTGIGFTMAIFIAELAFEPHFVDSVKIGVFSASLTSAAAGFLTLAWLTSSREQQLENTGPSSLE
ncbi:Na+/H+ antiporter NhaA [Methylocystis sp. B8]|uniref:Na+/H+ antiporter NhaA n=1 Tax=Methylocystis sp. B8 TaxID=544938 RepID=UPI0010FCDCFE|nr:Na+/H+ antiporter NhaA [Methylocystis sp. B8]TLG73712.1 Na+/H+ antiporter NhaA [Methylocystis sp. B8]